MLFYAILCYFMLFPMLFYAVLGYFMQFYVNLCYFMLFHVFLYYFMIFYTILCYVPYYFYVILCYFMLALGGDPRTPLEFSENNIDFSYLINRRFSNRNPIGFGQTCGRVLLLSNSPASIWHQFGAARSNLGGFWLVWALFLCYFMLFYAIHHAILCYFSLFCAILCYFM